MTGPPQTPDWLGPEVQALALRLWNIGFQVEAAKKIAAALVAHPTRGSDGGWTGPVTIADGIILWVHLPAVKAAP